MITLETGDILQADAEALVNTVNTEGVMGKGIALQFRKAYPENYAAYKRICARKELHPGKMFVFDRHSFTNPRYIINFPTKTSWKQKSRYEYIESGLVDLVRVVKNLEIKSIAIPPLGSGLGGLDWNRVRKMIWDSFESIKEINVYIYEPKGAPQPENISTRTQKPKMTFGRAALLELMHTYAVPGYDYRLSLLEIQKLMYFLQEAGVPLRLSYAKHIYGPYADNLRHVLDRIEGHYITGYGDGSISPDTPIRIKQPSILHDAEAFLNEYPEVYDRIRQVKKLIEGFESPFGMELLASIHWVCTRELANCSNIDTIATRLHAWSDRKRKSFKPYAINVAWQRLREQGWLANGSNSG